jgi:alpha-1,2-mannosyltransferase
MVGSVRDAADGRRVEALRALADELDITVRATHSDHLKGVPADCCLLAPQDNVEIVVNADYPTLLAWLGRASVGLSTMVDEHFGINVVEFMVRCSTGL